MQNYLTFPDRGAFRAWLEGNCASSPGVWLLFGKKGGPATLSAQEALEEALCFGWIDGQMQRIDGQAYLKYFSARRPNSKWSEKNKALAVQLEQQGKMTEDGRRKIEEAKKNGQWSAPKPPPISELQIACIAELLKENPLAHQNFMAMPLSVKKTYARAYLGAKTDAGRERRLSWMTERLAQNLKPM